MNFILSQICTAIFGIISMQCKMLVMLHKNKALTYQESIELINDIDKIRKELDV